MELVYFFCSIILAVFIYGGLRRYDGPKPNSRALQVFYMSPHMDMGEKLKMFHYNGIRRQLSGSWFLVIWMFFLWLAFPIFFSGQTIPVYAGIIFAFPGGWAFAVAIYNILKIIDRNANW